MPSWLTFSGRQGSVSREMSSLAAHLDQKGQVCTSTKNILLRRWTDPVTERQAQFRFSLQRGDSPAFHRENAEGLAELSPPHTPSHSLHPAAAQQDPQFLSYSLPLLKLCLNRPLPVHPATFLQSFKALLKPTTAKKPSPP